MTVKVKTKNKISPANGIVTKQTYEKLFVGADDVKKPEEMSFDSPLGESRKSKSILSRYSKK